MAEAKQQVAETEPMEGILHGPPPDRKTAIGLIIFLIAVAFSAFQVYTAAYTPLSSLVIRSIHVGFLLLLTFALAANQAGPRRPTFWLFWLFGIAGFVLGLYHWIFESDLIVRAGLPNDQDIIVGVVMVALVFVAAYQIMGPALPIICALFLAYAVFGQYLPSPLNHRGYGFDQVIDQLFLGTEGIFGVPTYVSSTYIFLFILFGSFLERAGMIQLFTDLALGGVGHTRGGPAKVSVVSSALMGTINGSGVANVVTTGQFTIPLMKRFGYKPAFAGAVEATSSMGGQIMPPVMGAVAFIMAETLGIPYIDVVTAAIVPAILYFGTVFWIVHLEAGRLNLLGLPKSECPDGWAALKRGWYLTIPLIVLVYLLFTGYTPLFAGTVGLALTAIIVLGSPLALAIGPTGLRVAFWVLLGLCAGAFFRFGVDVVFVIIAALAAIHAFRKGGKATLTLTVESLSDGARNALSVGVACAIVGVIIAVMTLTGLGSNFVRAIVEIGQGNLFLSLILTMLTCLVLGMGIPTIPNYIITSSLVGPALLQLDVPLLVSHMFVFYFGILADLTPPVALAAFAAAPIARAPGLTIGLNCLRIATAGFVVPFMAVYAPILMLQDGGPYAEAFGFWGGAFFVFVKAALAVMLWGAAAIGYLRGRLGLLERAFATVAAFTLVASIPLTDEIGLLLAALFFGWRWRAGRRTEAGTAAP